MPTRAGSTRMPVWVPFFNFIAQAPHCRRRTDGPRRARHHPRPEERATADDARHALWLDRPWSR